MKRKPFNLLFWTGLILILISLLNRQQNKAIDIHLHDIYFVITYTHILWSLIVIALVLWTVYLLTNKLLYSKILTWVHVITTTLALLLLSLTLIFAGSVSAKTPRFYDFSNWNSFTNYSSIVKVVGFAVFVFLVGQVLLVLNLILGVVKRLTRGKIE